MKNNFENINKKDYHIPVLIEYGTISSLTNSGLGAEIDGHATDPGVSNPGWYAYTALGHKLRFFWKVKRTICDRWFYFSFWYSVFGLFFRPFCPCILRSAFLKTARYGGKFKLPETKVSNSIGQISVKIAERQFALQERLKTLIEKRDYFGNWVNWKKGNIGSFVLYPLVFEMNQWVFVFYNGLFIRVRWWVSSTLFNDY